MKVRVVSCTLPGNFPDSGHCSSLCSTVIGTQVAGHELVFLVYVSLVIHFLGYHEAHCPRSYSILSILTRLSWVSARDCSLASVLDMEDTC